VCVLEGEEEEEIQRWDFIHNDDVIIYSLSLRSHKVHFPNRKAMLRIYEDDGDDVKVYSISITISSSSSLPSLIIMFQNYRLFFSY
jgi:hypothetical protein